MFHVCESPVNVLCWSGWMFLFLRCFEMRPCGSWGRGGLKWKSF
jgi:hypothetical protein